MQAIKKTQRKTMKTRENKCKERAKWAGLEDTLQGRLLGEYAYLRISIL